jgi:TolB-like protein
MEAAEALAATASSERPASRPSRKWIAATVGAVALVAAGALLWPLRPTTRTTTPVRVLVLPFRNAGVARDSVYPEALASAIRSRIATVSGTEVIAAASTPPSTVSPLEAGKQVGAGFVLAGTVVWRSGDSAQARVVAELVEVGGSRGGQTRWQANYDIPASQLASAEGRIVEEVAGGLGLSLEATEIVRLRKPPTTSVAAYQAYLRGRDSGAPGQRGRPPSRRLMPG